MHRTPRRASGAARSPSRRLARLIMVLALGLLTAACAGPQTILEPKGPFASKPDGLFRLTFWIAVVVFVIVQGLIVYAAIRFRSRDDDDERLPVQVHGNTKLEILWTVVPAMILAAIAVPTVQQIFELSRVPANAMTVEVVGHRWWWEFRYPDTGIVTANELVIPVNRPIRLRMTSEDSVVGTGVIHSFWVPALAGKQDVVPGRVTTLNMQADVTGRFLGECTEYCGLSHVNMRNRAVVKTQAEYDQWVTDQQKGAAVPESGTLAAQGQELFSTTCATCHIVRKDAAASAADFATGVGPDLTHLLSRKQYAGAIFNLYKRENPDDPNSPFTDQLNEKQLRAWVRDAPSQKAMRPAQGYSMRSFTDLTDDQLDSIIAYLKVLQ